MGNPGYSSRREPRWGILLPVALLHVAALVALARAFEPGFTSAAIEKATALVTVTVTAPPAAEPSHEPDPGTAGEEGRKATPLDASVPEAPLSRPSAAPATASTGNADVAGGGEQGEGSGAGGEGQGTGSGRSGTGPGNGSRPLELISGTIDDARDYPTPPGGRQVRRGHDVVIELTVGPSGRVTACRVTDPSPDPEADAITCRLATERFVFRPRLDSSGQPVTGIYRWRQRWF